MLLKGTMSRQAHARVDEKHFEIVGPTFSNTVGEFRKLFLSVESRSSSKSYLNFLFTNDFSNYKSFNRTLLRMC